MCLSRYIIYTTTFVNVFGKDRDVKKNLYFKNIVSTAKEEKLLELQRHQIRLYNGSGKGIGCQFF